MMSSAPECFRLRFRGVTECSSNTTLKLLEVIVGVRCLDAESEPVGFTNPDALVGFLDTPDFTIVESLRNL